MKKIYLFLLAAAASLAANAQTVPNGGMETWRSSTSGTGPVMNISAPISWYGFDSVIIADGQTFGPLFGSGTDYKVQLFQDMATFNSGTSSARLMTMKQDIFGYIGGIMSNAKIDIDVAEASTADDPLTAVTYTGGTPTTLRIMTVSAYTKYLPGIDTATHMMGGLDTGFLNVQAITTAYGTDSVIGTAYVAILPGSTFTQITAPVTYTDTYNTCDIIRITFGSSSLQGEPLDSSTLYVDDVTMTGVPQTSHLGVGGIVQGAVSVYPNPADGVLYVDGAVAGSTITLVSVTGQVMAMQTLTGNDVVQVGKLAAGVYIYVIADKAGNTIQRGQAVVR